jgi:hypothetical protein
MTDSGLKLETRMTLSAHQDEAASPRRRRAKQPRAQHARIMSQPHIGDVAEKFVEFWTSQAGFTVMTVQRDRRGWDSLCEFTAPRPPSNSDPLGLETVDFCAKLQVKGTRAIKRAVRVKLSNMFRAVDDVLPWFFLIVRVDSKAQRPLEVALVHIGPAIIESVLKRIYHLPRAARASFHRHSFDLKWTSRELVPSPYPASIRQIVYATVGSDPHSYARTKRDSYQSAGRAGAEMRATFQIRGATEDELYRRLSRSAIGLDDALAISDLVVTTTRFGITEPSERLSSREGAAVRIEPTASELESELVVSRADGSGAIPLKCSVRFSAAVFPQLPKEYWLLRFQTRLLDLVFGEAQGHFNARLLLPRDDEQITLSELAPSFALLDFLGHSKGTQLQLRLLRAGKEVPLGQIVLPEELPSELAKLTRAVCTSWSWPVRSELISAPQCRCLGSMAAARSPSSCLRQRLSELFRCWWRPGSRRASLTSRNLAL